jgi:hypothetical protein
MNFLISGEKIQEIADIYLGYPEDFRWNPYIDRQKHKHKNIGEITSLYDNLRIVFCYTHCIDTLANIIHFFQNDFVLITHNSDENVEDDKKAAISQIVNSDKLVKWYTQNLCIQDISKVIFLPIGIANQQWVHGAHFRYFYENLYIPNESAYQKRKQEKSIYFFFKILTNKNKRQLCYDSLINKIPFLNKISPMDNFKRLSDYEYCICPEGNGVDTHRFWEALYLKCVPIVIRNPLIDIIKNTTNLPMVVLNSWQDLHINELPIYDSFDFLNSANYLDLNFYKNIIHQSVKH